MVKREDKTTNEVKKVIRCEFCGEILTKNDSIVSETDGYYHLWCAITSTDDPSFYGYEG